MWKLTPLCEDRQTNTPELGFAYVLSLPKRVENNCLALKIITRGTLDLKILVQSIWPFKHMSSVFSPHLNIRTFDPEGDSHLMLYMRTSMSF